jgi:anti-sigma regulatory factor (Ser/Thr protein kinase)
VGPVSVVLVSDATAPSAARAFLREHVPERQLGAQAPTAQLLVSELVTNAVRYGKGDTLRVVVDLRERRLLVSVTDSNPVPPRLGEREDEQGGRGMTLVDALASGWGTRESGSGKTVWFTLDAG